METHSFTPDEVANDLALLATENDAHTAEFEKHVDAEQQETGKEAD